MRTEPFAALRREFLASDARFLVSTDYEEKKMLLQSMNLLIRHFFQLTEDSRRSLAEIKKKFESLKY